MAAPFAKMAQPLVIPSYRALCDYFLGEMGLMGYMGYMGLEMGKISLEIRKISSEQKKLSRH